MNEIPKSIIPSSIKTIDEFHEFLFNSLFSGIIVEEGEQKEEDGKKLPPKKNSQRHKSNKPCVQA